MENFNHIRIGIFQCLIVFLCFVLPETAFSQVPIVSLQPVITTGLTAPMQVLNAGDGSGRIFVTERAGVIKVFGGTAPATSLTTFLNLNTPVLKVGTIQEGGLLSVAFHPDYEKASNPNRGVFFALYTNTRVTAGDLVIEKYTVANPAANTATVVSANVILKIPHRYAPNHNGGEMHFGNDGLLYISTGDGGGSGDPNNNAQKTLYQADSSHFLGKMLRINVNVPSTGRAYSIPGTNPFGNEIYDYGLRNPFRWSFDRQTGDMWIGDVGQNNWEEIDFRAATSPPGQNYGWNCFEGHTTYAGAGPSCGSVTNYMPAYDYDGQSVIGGHVYRGGTYLSLIGYYVGTDYFTGNIHLIKRNDANTAWTTTVQAGTIQGITDIGEAENGELYAVSQSQNANAIYSIRSSGPLPVKLVSFDGVKTIEGTRLFWETASEENFKEFKVEYSVDMNHFTNVGTVFSQNSLNGAKYQFSHSDNFSGNAYYRLKMIDSDGSSDYSRIIVVNNEDFLAGNFVRPSLINSETMSLMIESTYQFLELTNMTGNTFLKQDISGKSGLLTIPVNNISSGIYIVRLIGNEKVNQQKVLILH